jgi:drug/metabolite transporter (DMT)-like permease
MTRKANFQYIFALGLLSGTLNSIVMKLAYQTASFGNDPTDVHFFHKPWFMSMVMFLAMLCALPLFYMQKDRKKLSMKTWMIVSIPSFCDLIGSSMQQVGLIFTPVSIYQMLKGSILLFSAALSVWFLNKKMYIHNWVGVLMCVIALTLVGISSVMTIDEQPIVVSFWEAMFGITIVVLGQIVCASQYVLEEFLLKPPNDVSAMAMVGMEGLWGTGMMGFVILPLFQYWVPGSDVGGVYENTSDALAMIANSSSLDVLLLISFVSVLIYNVCGVMVTQQASAVHHTFLDATRTIFVWAASVAVYYHPGADRSFGEPVTWWSLLQLIGFVILMLGECIYDGLIPLPKRWFASEIEFDPRMSPVRIPTMTPSPHGFLIKDQFEQHDGSLNKPLL